MQEFFFKKKKIKNTIFLQSSNIETCSYFLNPNESPKDNENDVFKILKKVKSLSRVWLLATPGTVAYQAPLSMGISRQEYWSEVPLPSPNYCLGNLKNIFDWI